MQLHKHPQNASHITLKPNNTHCRENSPNQAWTILQEILCLEGQKFGSYPVENLQKSDRKKVNCNNNNSNQVKLGQSWRKHRAFKAGDFVGTLTITTSRQVQRGNMHIMYSYRASHYITANPNKPEITMMKLTNQSSANPAGNPTPSRLVIVLPCCE